MDGRDKPGHDGEVHALSRNSRRITLPVVVIHAPMNLSRVASARPQYSRNITGSGRLTAIWPSSPASAGVPSGRITATVWPGTGLPIAPGRDTPSIAAELSTRLHSVWP